MRTKIPRQMRAEMRRDLMAQMDESMPKEMAEEHVDHILEHVEAYAQVEIRRMKRDPMIRAAKRRVLKRGLLSLVLGGAAGFILATFLSTVGFVVLTFVCVPVGYFIGKWAGRTKPPVPQPDVAGDDHLGGPCE